MKQFFILLFLLAAMTFPARADIYPVAEKIEFVKQKETETDSEKEKESGASLFLLKWEENRNAVWYDLQIFPQAEYFGRKEMRPPLYEDPHVFRNGLILPMSILENYKGKGDIYYRVRAIGLDRQIISSFSSPIKIKDKGIFLERTAPVPRVSYHQGNGTVLLYPAYSFVKLPGAASYEIEVTDEIPENREGFLPSQHRIWSATVTLPELFDPQPRIGTFYWRVRGLDEGGNPLGEWSEAQKIMNDPDENWEVGILGDSISHGGGRMSYSPADWPYNYGYYLDFPTINMSKSGDESYMVRDRFERDVLPFHVKYLLIMVGTNNLRMGKSVEEEIEDLKILQQKCRENGIIPILLTLPPMNPDNIRKYYHQDTAENWKEAFLEVNDWIRTQEHIDTAKPFESYEVMPAELAADGLHPDAEAKKMIADVINEEMKKIRKT